MGYNRSYVGKARMKTRGRKRKDGRLMFNDILWDDILKLLSINTDPEVIIIDTSFIKLHQHGFGAKGISSNKILDRVKVDDNQGSRRC